MPQTAARPAAAGRGGQEESSTKSMIQTVVQGIAVFMVSQYLMSLFTGKNKGGDASQQPGTAASLPMFSDRPDVATVSNWTVVPDAIVPMWPSNASLDINIYVSGAYVLPRLSSVPEESLVMRETDFTIGNFKDTRTVSTTITLPKQAQENGTLWAHFFIALSGAQLDPTANNYDQSKAHHFRRPLTQYLPKKRVRKLKNLLDKSNETEVTEEGPSPGAQIGSFYHPNFTVSLIPETGVQRLSGMHPALRKNINLEPTGARDESGRYGWYYPVVFINTFWQLRSHMTELNSTVLTVPLNFELNNMANWKYSIFASMDEGMKQSQTQATSGGNPMQSDGSEFEKFKEILLDSNPYLLGTTFIATVLHMIFEGLAFKSDISHWRKKKDIIGTSVRTILANVFMQAVIFLYLVDNSEGTSWMILASQGFGILLEAWKITKMVDVRLRAPGPDSRFKFLPYVIVFEDKHKLSEVEQKTQEYDSIAFQYLYIIAIPLLGAYAAYSLIYETHKSWYSFVIETLVGSVYAYGFLMMVPSLYINYRLKSVAHMPSKTMTYKFLNTFIDDLFAFTIRMPTLHRLATLRDDVIFFIWLYQKWIYKVDYSRVNEFGQGGEDDEVEDEAPKAITDATTTAEGGKDPLEATTSEKVSGADQDTKQLKPTAPVASATGAEKKTSAKKRKA